MEASEDFYARCKSCGNMHPNCVFTIVRAGEGPDDSVASVFSEEKVMYYCPYCKKETELEYIEGLDCELSEVVKVSGKLEDAHPTCFPCPHARFIREYDAVCTEVMYCSQLRTEVRESDHVLCERRLNQKHAKQGHAEGCAMDVSEDFYARCKNCGKMYFNSYYGHYRQGDGTDHPEGTHWEVSYEYICPYCHKKDAGVEYLEVLPCGLGEVLNVLPALKEANPTCISCPRARIDMGDDEINTGAMQCSQSGMIVHEADKIPCKWRFRSE